MRVLVMVLVAAGLGWSFWQSDAWLQLCAGLAIFLFGMQCLEEGLRQLAGGRLEQVLSRSTGTPWKALLFGVGGTALLQSSTLVSLLTIAFISSGLIHLAGGIAIIFGANLGATTGIWLLALAGHGLSLSPLALPLMVFGVLAGFTGPRGKAAGRVVLGVAFIFFGIDQLQAGFDAFGGDVELAAVQLPGVVGTLLFAAVGLLATVVLQSSHATLMLTLTALSAGQVELGQALALAIGSNVGSSVSTAVVGALGGNRSGQRLALAHVLFNAVTASLALLALPVLSWVTGAVADAAGFGSDELLQLALFHTLFNALGVALFWPWQDQLAQLLRRWLPEPQTPEVLTAESSQAEGQPPVHRERARYLSEQALGSVEAAAAAVVLELRHLTRLCLEVICQGLCIPVEQLTGQRAEDEMLKDRPDHCGNVDALYQQHIKGVYGELLSFMGRLQLPMDEAHLRYWQGEQEAARQLVEAVKDAKHLQKNLVTRMGEADSPVREIYLELRQHLFDLLRALYRYSQAPVEQAGVLQEQLVGLDWHDEVFDAQFRQRLFAMVRRGEVDGLQAGSLLNDLNYADRIQSSLREAMTLAEAPDTLRELHNLARQREAEVKAEQ